MRLDEAVEAILAAAVEAVRGAVEAADSGAALEDVEEVVLGDRARPMPDLPSIWLVPGIATQARNTYGQEAWSLPLSVAAMVKDDDPTAGASLARRIAAGTRSAVLEARRSLGENVIDAVSESFDPTPRTHADNRALSWVEAVVTVKFSVTE